MPKGVHAALSHHWLVGMRGGEKVLEEFSLLFPGTPISTLVAAPSRLSSRLRGHSILTSKLQWVPFGAAQYKKLLPLFPLAVGDLRVAAGSQFVLSSDASVIKGLKVPDGVDHVCYCHSPPRYLWDMSGEYMNSAETGGAVGRFLFERVIPYVREFDFRAAQRVTEFIANSRFVQQRIKRYYGRESAVVHPPVALDDFAPVEEVGDFYLIVSQLVPYKRVDLAVKACSQLGRPLVVIGEGAELDRLKEMAGPEVRFLGSQPLSVLREHYQRCRAFLFPGIEDFGITPLEAQASGRPVLAFGEGGALETVVDGKTGLFFAEQSVEALIECIKKFEALGGFDPAVCRSHAEGFGPVRFRGEIKQFLESRFPEMFRDFAWPA